MEHPEGPEASEHEAVATREGSSTPARLEDHEDTRARRWQLFRDLAVFQAKLLVDGLKDLVLSPVSLVAALVGLVLDRREPGRSFYMVLRWGHGFDRWVNLFGASQRALPPASEPHAAEPAPSSIASPREGLDAYVAGLERVLVEQYRRGGLTAKAKDAIDQALDGLQTRKPPPS
jgi:hypothetical protein